MDDEMLLPNSYIPDKSQLKYILQRVYERMTLEPGEGEIQALNRRLRQAFQSVEMISSVAYQSKESPQAFRVAGLVVKKYLVDYYIQHPRDAKEKIEEKLNHVEDTVIRGNLRVVEGGKSG